MIISKAQRKKYTPIVAGTAIDSKGLLYFLMRLFPSDLILPFGLWNLMPVHPLSLPVAQFAASHFVCPSISKDLFPSIWSPFPSLSQPVALYSIYPLFIPVALSLTLPVACVADFVADFVAFLIFCFVSFVFSARAIWNNNMMNLIKEIILEEFTPTHVRWRYFLCQKMIVLWSVVHLILL